MKKLSLTLIMLVSLALMTACVGSKSSAPKPAPQAPAKPAVISVDDFTAAAYNGNMATIKAYLAKGGDINAYDSDGDTALITASKAKKHSRATVEFLLKNGADVNKASADGNSAPLYEAVIHDALSIPLLLIENGADVNWAKKDDGATSLLAAISRAGNGDKIYIDTALMLIGYGADVNKKGNDYYNPLGMASFHGLTKIVRTLVEKGANIHAKDFRGTTPLMDAALSNQTGIIIYLIGLGAKINAQDNKGMTALMYAVSKGHVPAVKALLENGADASIKSKKNETAYMLASLEGHTQIANLLK